MAKAPDIKTIALIVAAGNSERFGGNLPKPYIQLGNKPLIRHTIDAFLTHPRIDGVRVVINRKHHMLYKQATRDISIFPPMFGAERRQDSVRLGLESIAHRNPQFVLIHDAARPLIDHETITNILTELEKFPAVLPYLPTQDTIRRISSSPSKEFNQMELLDRNKLNAAQTPQRFHFQSILNAHQQNKSLDVPDDIALAEHVGMAVQRVKGNAKNIKLTTPDQLPLLLAMSGNSTMSQTPKDAYEIRTGMGFDVHPFTDHAEDKPAQYRTIALCGVRIPFHKRLKGHSDSDVALHALVDAILGAIGEGDIGQHFSQDDPKWAGADSSRFLLYAFELVKQRKGEINNIDITIIAEQPKVYPHREVMRQQIANLLKLDVRRVNVKATTTEKLGFLGRAEGMAAQAVATIKLPVE